jgi:hypothetical protein
MWWADNDRGWFPDDDVPAHEVARENGSVVLRNNIIGKQVELKEARTISFTWMASPFKPLPKGWRMIAATDDGTFFQPFRGVRVNPKTGQKYWDSSSGANINWIHPESDDPMEWSKLWAEQKAQADQIVHDRRLFDLYGSRTGISFQHMSFQLMGYGVKSMQKDIYGYFGDEWFPEGWDTWNKTYTDYGMWLLDRAFGEGGVVSTYWDLSFPTLYASPLSGLAYRLPDGRMQPGYNTLNCRSFFQRLWAVQDKHGLNPGCTGTHSTQAYMYPCLPWLDAVLDGERDWNLDASEMDWIDYYPIERMRALSSPHNWGVGICWMSNYTSSDSKKIIAAKTSQAEYLWMHDSWLNPYMGPAYDVTKMPQKVLDWGLNGTDVVYIPYWRNGGVSSGDPDVLVSVWRMNGRVVIGVYNYNRKAAKDVKLALDLRALGVAGKGKSVTSRDLYRRDGSASCVFDGAAGTISISSLAPHSGRFIGIRATDQAALAKAQEQFARLSKTPLPESALDLGIVTDRTVYSAPGESALVQTEEGVRVAMWQLPDRVLFAVTSDAAAPKNAVLKLDMGKLGLESQLKWQEFIGVRDLNGSSTLDYYARTLTVKDVTPGSVRLVVVRRY